MIAKGEMFASKYLHNDTGAFEKIPMSSWFKRTFTSYFNLQPLNPSILEDRIEIQEQDFIYIVSTDIGPDSYCGICLLFASF